jgi:hypothetical protein
VRGAAQGGGHREGGESHQEHSPLPEDVTEPTASYQAGSEHEGVTGDDEFRFSEGRVQRGPDARKVEASMLMASADCCSAPQATSTSRQKPKRPATSCSEGRGAS